MQRHHDLAQTPFDGLWATGLLPAACQAELHQLRSQTNPRQLRREIYELIDHILDLPGATPGRPQDLFQTLGLCTIFVKGAGGLVT